MKTKPSHNNHNNLVQRYQQGDEQALKLLIRRFHPTMLRVIRHHTRAVGTVDDIAQESWVAIIRKLENVKLKISFEAWAITIARRKAIDWVREQQRKREYARLIADEPEIESGSDNPSNTEFQVAVLMEKLSDS